jgi:putative transposase
MPRRLRCNTGGYAYHVLNRAVDRATLFHKDGDYAAFEKVLRQAKEWRSVRLSPIL